LKHEANKSGRPHNDLLDGRGSGGEPFEASIGSVAHSQSLDNVQDSALGKAAGG